MVDIDKYINVIDKFIEDFQKLPEDIRKRKAKEMLTKMGVLDENGKMKENIVDR